MLEAQNAKYEFLLLACVLKLSLIGSTRGRWKEILPVRVQINAFLYVFEVSSFTLISINLCLV